MIVGVGVDVAGVARLRAVYARHGARFLDRVLTPAERAYVLLMRDPAERLAGRWAAKEAALKALGTGVGEGLRLRDVEILAGADGAPRLVLHGAALARAQRLRVSRGHVTLTHAEGLAVAVVILESA